MQWSFKRNLRANAMGWGASRLACGHLNGARKEIETVSKQDPVAAAEGVVSLCERIWPSLQHVDSSSGVLGATVESTLQSLLPILVQAPVDAKTRRKWLARLEQALEDDGVEYLGAIAEGWGKICREPELINEWADELLPLVLERWISNQPGHYTQKGPMCLSCLLEAGRYDELRELLCHDVPRFWHHQSYYAEALLRQGETNAAILFAESNRSPLHYYDYQVSQFCERVLLEAGRREEAYDRYGRYCQASSTYINHFRSIAKRYPEIGKRRILLDLLEDSENPGDWFATARSIGELDIALGCATNGRVNPGTLATAARDTCENFPEFAIAVAVRCLEELLEGYGFDKAQATANTAVISLKNAMDRIQNSDEHFERIRLLMNKAQKHKDAISTHIYRLMKQTWPDIY